MINCTHFHSYDVEVYFLRDRKGACITQRKLRESNALGHAQKQVKHDILGCGRTVFRDRALSTAGQ